MADAFEGVWADIRRRLRPGILVRNWSADRGYTGGEFRINDVDGGAVIVRSGQMGQERRVSTGDFQRLFTFWGAYNRGTIGRAELGKRSQNTTYILSILHWRDQHQSSTASVPLTSPAIPAKPSALKGLPSLGLGPDERVVGLASRFRCRGCVAHSSAGGSGMVPSPSEYRPTEERNHRGR